MDASRINSEISRLSAEIQNSAAKIVHRRSASNEITGLPAEKEESYLSNYNFRVVYLESSSLFNTQKISFEVNGQSKEEPDNFENVYSDSSYRYAYNLLNDTDVLIDFMHKNNRSFDYMV